MYNFYYKYINRWRWVILMKGKKLNRFTALLIITCLAFTVILSKLFSLQIVHGEEYLERTNTSTRGRFLTQAPRGKIMDKNGAELAANELTYVLVFNNTKDSRENFLPTMEKVFEVLDFFGEKQKDDFPIKIDETGENLYFDFRERDESNRRWLELRFKKDRGFEDRIKRSLFGKKIDLNAEEQEKLDEELLKLSAEHIFNSLLETYKINENTLASSSLEEKRRYLIVRDDLKMASFSNRTQITLANSISRETAFAFYQKLYDLTGVDVASVPVRVYPYGELGSSFLGYISKIPSWQKDRYEERGYSIATDYIGMSGLESSFESRLKGSKGETVAVVNSSGRIVTELGRMEPYPGQDLHLTIDKDVQAAAERALDETMKRLRGLGRVKDVYPKNATRGAAVAIDVNTGAIIALASRPGFDPNFFAAPGGLSTEIYRQYFNLNTEELAKSMGYSDAEIERFFPLDRRIKGNTTIREDVYDILPKPMFNYATSSLIPPGSTFKSLTAVVGLETGVITPSTTIHDAGFFDDGKNFRTTFAGGSYGAVNLARALEVSSNPFFMMTAKQLKSKFGDDILAEYATKMGLGTKSPSGIEIQERHGQVLSTSLLQDIYSQQYLWVTMSTLKEGRAKQGGVLPSIDLYDRDTDSTKLREIKKELKSLIQETIKTGRLLKSSYRELLLKLIEADPLYRDKEKVFTNTTINSIITTIEAITIYDAHTQIKNGSNIYNASIGQGVNAFTPLEMANFTATLVNGGKRYKLHLVEKITDPDGNILEQTKPQVLENVNLKKSTIDAVKHGMYLVNHGAGGTAARTFRDFPMKTGGKTGSATFSKEQEKYGRTSFGWYIGFAPYDNPQIAVSVVIFDGGHGGSVTPVAKAIFEEYFKEELGLNSQVIDNE
jgi:penicillin-binding protein 2